MNLVATKTETDNSIDLPEFVLAYAMKQPLKGKLDKQACEYKNY
jgi:hypothetical protein